MYQQNLADDWRALDGAAAALDTVEDAAAA